MTANTKHQISVILTKVDKGGLSHNLDCRWVCWHESFSSVEFPILEKEREREREGRVRIMQFHKC